MLYLVFRPSRCFLETGLTFVIVTNNISSPLTAPAKHTKSNDYTHLYVYPTLYKLQILVSRLISSYKEHSSIVAKHLLDLLVQKVRF